MSSGTPNSPAAEFLGRLEQDRKLKALRLGGPTYEKRLSAALRDPQMRAYLEKALDGIGHDLMAEIAEGKPKVDSEKLLNDLLAAVDANPLFPDQESRDAAKQAIRGGFAAEPTAVEMAGAIIKAKLLENAKWDAKNPGKPFPGFGK